MSKKNLKHLRQWAKEAFTSRNEDAHDEAVDELCAALTAAERERDALRQQVFAAADALGMPFDDEDARTLVERASVRMDELRGYEDDAATAEQRAERAEAKVRRIRSLHPHSARTVDRASAYGPATLVVLVADVRDAFDAPDAGVDG